MPTKRSWWPSFIALINREAMRVAHLIKCVAESFWAGLILLVVILVINEILSESVVIEPLSVPETLSKNGITQQVIAAKLRDAVNDLTNQAHTFARRQMTINKSEGPDITVPNVGISVRAFAAEIAKFLGFSRRREITGEFTIQNGSIFVDLRLNDVPFYVSKSGTSVDHFSDAIKTAAWAVLERTQPYIHAVLLSEKNKEAAFQAASRLTENPLARQEDVKWAHVLKGNILGSQGPSDEAATEYREAINIDPKFAIPYYGLGKIMRERKEYNEAIKEYRIAIKLDRKDAYPHDGLGDVFTDLGQYDKDQYDKAIQEYEIAINLDPKDAYPHNGRGNALRKLKRNDEAIKEYNAAIKLDSKFAAAHHGLANAFVSLHRYDEAISEYKAAINLDPENAYPHYGLANILFNRLHPQYDEAIKEYKKAIEIDPKFALPHHGLGSVLLMLQKYDEAIEEYQEAIKLDPNEAYPHNGLGEIYRKRRQYSEADKEYRVAIALDPDYAYAHYGLGNSLLSQRQDDEAIKEYRNAIRLEPELLEFHMSLKELLRALGRAEEAEAEQKAIEKIFGVQGH